MTFEPASIVFRLDDVIVQNEPAAPVYCEHSFVTCRAPLRGVAVAEPAVTANAAAAIATASAIVRFITDLLPSQVLVARGRVPRPRRSGRTARLRSRSRPLRRRRSPPRTGR